jgi:hypothetical protein
VTLSSYCFLYGSVTMRSLRTVVDLHVAVSDIQLLSVAMKSQEWIPFAPTSSYRIFRYAVNNKSVGYCFLDFSQIWSSLTDFLKMNFTKNPSSMSCVHTCGHRYRRKDRREDDWRFPLLLRRRVKMFTHNHKLRKLPTST